MNLNGYYNEFDFVDALNDKYVYELKSSLKKMLVKIFVKVKCNDHVLCYKSFKTDKADIVISINSIKKFVSIKSGKNNSIHLEHIKTFEEFLKGCKIPLNKIDIYKNYHYAEDDSCRRICAKEYQVMNQEKILEFNNYINSEEILLKVFDRFLFKGIHEYNNYVDVMIYGTIDSFNFFTRQEIIDFLLKKKHEIFNSIHFSLLCLQPWTRNLNYNSKYEYRRDYVQVKWYRLEDIIKNM